MLVLTRKTNQSITIENLDDPDHPFEVIVTEIRGDGPDGTNAQVRPGVTAPASPWAIWVSRGWNFQWPGGWAMIRSARLRWSAYRIPGLRVGRKSLCLRQPVVAAVVPQFPLHGMSRGS